MVSSFVLSLLILVLRKFGIFIPTHYALILTVAVTTISWMLTAFLGPQTDREKLIAFYKKVRPFGPGWKKIREEAGISEAEAKIDLRQLPEGPHRLGLRVADASGRPCSRSATSSTAGGSTRSSFLPSSSPAAPSFSGS